MLEDIHAKLLELAAVAELLALELGERVVAPEDAGRPSVVAIADHLAECLAELRDRTEPQ